MNILSHASAMRFDVLPLSFPCQFVWLSFHPAQLVESEETGIYYENKDDVKIDPRFPGDLVILNLETLEIEEQQARAVHRAKG